MKKIVSILTLLLVTILFVLPASAEEGTFSVSSETGEFVVVINGKLQLTLDSATGDAEGIGKVWMSSDPAVATVDAKGVVTAKKAGVVTISCTSADGTTALAECEVEAVKGVQSLKLAEQTKELLLCNDEDKGCAQLSVTVLPEDTYFQAVTWVSANEEVATVDQNGIVRAVSAGRTDITVTSTDKNRPASVKCAVTVKQGVTGITIASDETLVYTGARLQLKVAVEPENAAKKQLKWTSADAAIASVDANGNVTGKAVGETVITAEATDGSGVSAEYKVEVRAKVKSLKLTDTNVTLLLGAGQDALKHKVAVETVPADAEVQGIDWTSSDESIVKVDADGILYGISAGKAVVTATSQDPACKVPVKCNVTVAQAVMQVTVSSSSEVIYTGTNLKLAAEVAPENAANKKLVWTSSDPKVATVDANGNVRGVAVGKAVVVAEAADGSGVKASCDVEVRAHVKGMKISDTAVTLLLGTDEAKAQKKLRMEITPADAFEKGIIWESSDETVVKVTSDGILQAVADGKATITATSKDETYKTAAKCTVTVGKAVKSIRLVSYSEQLPKGATKKIEARISPKNVLNSKLVWKSSNENVLKVDANGNVRGVGVGKATITCRATDGSGVSAETSFQVVQGVTGLSAKKTSIIITQGDSKTLSVMITPSDATNKKLMWHSENSSICSVSENGRITGERKGTTKVVAVATDGSSKSITFNVTVEPINPVTLEGLGTGVYAGNLLALTFRNNCQKSSIRDIYFDCTLYWFDGRQISSGSYHTDRISIAPGGKKVVKRTLSGVGIASHYEITITGVEFADGTVYYVPYAEQRTTNWG